VVVPPARIQLVVPTVLLDPFSSKLLVSALLHALLDSTLILHPSAAWLAPTTVSAAPRTKPASLVTRLMTIESLTVPLLGAFLISATSRISLRYASLAPLDVRCAHLTLIVQPARPHTFCTATVSATL
jgi:hypothetical protein